MTEQNSAAEALEDSPSEVQEFLLDAVEMDDVEDPDLGDVQAEPGEVVAFVDGVEVRNAFDESDRVLPVEDDSGQVIGRDSFPEDASGVEPLEVEPDDEPGEVV